MVGLEAASSKSTCATRHASQVRCSPSPCVPSRLPLPCASAADTQTLTGTSGSVSSGVPAPFQKLLSIYCKADVVVLDSFALCLPVKRLTSPSNLNQNLAV
ncbi:unnamed protein product [Rangifer tarandus platyrhynchus]|uniref:Uncharacterized protein n=1 Tax=Rangifer tarandus platyrhynchus TaxID=3082113 RepID=A0AC59ZL34_RANTA